MLLLIWLAGLNGLLSVPTINAEESNRGGIKKYINKYDTIKHTKPKTIKNLLFFVNTTKKSSRSIPLYLAIFSVSRIFSFKYLDKN